MGLFGGDDNDNPAQDRANQLVEEQINQNKAELEQKRQSLVSQRMNIIKSQGAETWSPDRGAAYSGNDATTKPSFPQGGGWFGGFARSAMGAVTGDQKK